MAEFEFETEEKEEVEPKKFDINEHPRLQFWTYHVRCSLWFLTFALLCFKVIMEWNIPWLWVFAPLWIPIATFVVFLVCFFAFVGVLMIRHYFAMRKFKKSPFYYLLTIQQEFKKRKNKDAVDAGRNAFSDAIAKVKEGKTDQTSK